MEQANKIPVSSTYAIIRRVIGDFGRPHLKGYLLAGVLMAIVAGCTSASAWLMKDLVNAAVLTEAGTSVMYYPLLVSGLFIVKGGFSYIQELMITRIGARIVVEVQRSLYDHLLRMNVMFYQTRSSSEIITRMTNGAHAVRDAINLAAVTLGRDLLTVLGLCGVMILQDPVLFAIVLITAPVAGFALRSLSASAKKAARMETGGQRALLSLSRDTVQGIRMVKSFQLEGLLQDKMDTATKAVEAQRNRLARIKSSVGPISEVLSGLAIAAVIFYATMGSQGDPKSVGSFFAFITALLLAGEPLRRLSRLHIDLTTAAERIAMLYEIIDQPQDEPEKDTRSELAVKDGTVTFRDVSFAYPGTRRGVLRDMSLVFPGGKFTALVGASGGGKTTILALMQGFFTPDKGVIEIDGVSISDVSLVSLRRNISYLDQDAFLFEGTIEDNIIGSSRDRDPDRVSAAGRSSSADAFISAMKDGYRSQLKELSSNLSGGQKQRIAIARAFYKDAPILLLDEPTSALDSETEQQIRQSVRTLAQGRTTVMVAHRLSTVRDADLIYVIAEGRVVEVGNHDELLARNGMYAALLRGQKTAPDEVCTDNAPEPAVHVLRSRSRGQ